MEDEIEYEEGNYEDDYNEQELNNDVDNEKKDEKQLIADYEIIKNSEIIKKRDKIIEQFIECSCLNYDEAELVLIYFNWNYDKLIDEWYDNTEKIKIDSHIEQFSESLKKISNFDEQNNISDKICPICFCDIEENNSLYLKCNHKICKECYIEYINNRIITEPMNILFTLCPLNGCNLYLTRTIFRKCITEKKMQKKFAKSVVFNFIRTNKNIKICPNLKCNFSIKVQDNIPKEIICECGYIFCFSCLNESHIPCSCEMVKQWDIYNEELKKNYSESIDKHGENFLWINENTKQCPNCGVSIEKNQGCNHMTCRKTAGGVDMNSVGFV